MIRKLENINKINNKNEIIEFIKKVSPFTEQNPRLAFIIREFMDNKMETPYIVMMNETKIDPVTKINQIKNFMLWSIGTTLYVGTEFVPEPELSKGVELSRYERAAS